MKMDTKQEYIWYLFRGSWNVDLFSSQDFKQMHAVLFCNKMKKEIKPRCHVIFMEPGLPP